MDEMKKVVTCKYCRKPEYYGYMHWFDGFQYCRKCISGAWQKNDPSRPFYAFRYHFPFYEKDGIDYTKEV